MTSASELLTSGINLSRPLPPLHPRSWIEAPAVVQAELAPMNLIQIGAFTGIYGGRVGFAEIGRYCSFAPGVDIASDQHPTQWLSSSMIQYVNDVHGLGSWLKRNGFEYREPSSTFASNTQAKIGNDVWLGKNVIVKSGVRIGDGAVIAAGAVVIDDVPPYAIAAGVPAQIKKFRFSERLIEKMLSVAWWRFNIAAIEGIDFTDPEGALSLIEEQSLRGDLAPYEGKKIPLAAKQ